MPLLRTASIDEARWVSYEDAYGTGANHGPNVDARTREVTTVILHHSDVDIAEEPPIQRARSIRAVHMVGQGFADTGYNLLVAADSSGQVIVISGRSDKYKGAHVFGMNDGTSGLCVMAKLESREPTAKELEAVLLGTCLLLNRYAIRPLGHNTFRTGLPLHDRVVTNLTDHRSAAFQAQAQSACPGTLGKYLPELQAQANTLMESAEFRASLTSFAGGAFRPGVKSAEQGLASATAGQPPEVATAFPVLA